MLAHAAAPLVVQEVVEEPPVGQSGQRVMEGKVGDLELQQFSLGNIGMGDDIKLGIYPFDRNNAHHEPALGIRAVAGIFQIEALLLAQQDPSQPLNSAQRRRLSRAIASA